MPDLLPLVVQVQLQAPRVVVAVAPLLRGSLRAQRQGPVAAPGRMPLHPELVPV
jgi:hypothetical protein